MNAALNPLIAPPPREVPLTDAPLVRVIAQVRFPEILAVEQREFVTPFQEVLRPQYPVLRQEQMQGLLLGPAGVASGKAQLAWRFNDIEGHWRVSLTAEFLAIETTKYTSRAEFIERLRNVLEALDEHVKPKLIDRIGLRYIDRVTGEAVNDVANLVRPEVSGILGAPIAAYAAHSLSESLFELSDARVLVRWGRLSAGATVDPAALEPVLEPSWILDLDMFSTRPIPFTVDSIVSETQRFAERIYAVFRWAVTDDFLRLYGGNP